MSNHLRSVIFVLVSIFSISLFAKQIDRPLRVGLYNNFPKVYQTENGVAKGIFPEILEEISDRENWQLEYIFGTWDESLQRLENGDIDIMPDVAVSEAREILFDFHQKSVLTSWGCIYTKSRPEINSVLDLQRKTVAVMKGSILTTGEDGIYNLVERYGIECEFLETDDYNEVFHLVRSGMADAGVVNRIFGSAFEEEYGLHLNNFIFFPTALRFAFPKKAAFNSELIDKIDSHLAAWQDEMDSNYYKILTNYKLYPHKGMPDWIWLLFIILIFLIIIFFVAFIILKWQIKKQTRLLQETNSKLLEEISEHQETLQLLQESRELYRSFVENIPGLVFMYDIDPQGKRLPLIQAKRNEEFLGDEIGKQISVDINKFFEYVLPEDMQKLQEISDQVEEEEKVLDIEYRVQLEPDKIKWFRSIGRVTIQPNGNRRWQGVILDIDDRKKVERQLELHRKHLEDLVEARTKDLQNRTEELEIANLNLKEADRLKSIFLASMSHELRTPLNSIIGFTGILLMGMVGELKDEQRKQLEIVKSSANHLLDLINEILDISKIEAGKAEISLDTFNIKELVEEVVKLLKPKADEKELELSYHLDSNIELHSDRRRIKQILINLAGNAVKFTETGSVNIEVQKIEDSKMQITVQDTGCGVKPEDLKKLFEPFQQIDACLTKKQEGTGLGLHLTQKILNLLDGSVKVESEFGRGTTFYVEIPLSVEDQ